MEGAVPAAAQALREAAKAADALLLVTPEYNGSLPAVLKNAIDWTSRPHQAGAITGKPVAVVGTSNGRYGDMQSLISERLLDESLRDVQAGYAVKVISTGDDYTVTATPATPNTGRYEYFSTSDRVIRYSLDSDLAPPDKAGEPID